MYAGLSLLGISHFAESSLPESVPSGQSIELVETRSFFDSVSESLSEKLGITYFSFIYGPGVIEKNFSFNPNQLGKPENDGVYAQNQVSIRYKFSSNMALDFQFRTRLFLTNGVDKSDFTYFRWEAPRIGLSGKILSGEDWSLVGAINTDFPYFMPAPFTGYQAQRRTVIFNPGMFANFKYEPRHSRWSVFSVVSPRYFFYTDRSAADDQLIRAGFIPENKPEMIIALQPTVSYLVYPKIKITLGSTIDYRKQVVSDWNPLKASLASNGDNAAWRLYAVPLTLGLSYSYSSALSIFPFVSTYPIAIQRKDANSGHQATLLESTSIGMWINGTIF
jgi:hypothetical protein